MFSLSLSLSLPNPTMDSQNGRLVLFMTIVGWWLPWTDGLQHRVGESIWSIPLNNDFYTNWSSTQSFQIGDTLFFEFQSDFHNVMQVSRREYEGCTADNPFQSFWIGPATIPLVEGGVYYFICSVANYCALGQKVSVTVHRYPAVPPSPPPLPPPLPLPLPLPPSDSSRPALPSRPHVVTSVIPQNPTHVSRVAPMGIPAVEESSVSMLSTRSSGVCAMGVVLGNVFLIRLAVYGFLLLL